MKLAAMLLFILSLAPVTVAIIHSEPIFIEGCYGQKTCGKVR